MLQVIIFSKDRACQLEFLLRTFRAQVTGASVIKVLYMSTNEFFEKGYNKVKQKYSDVCFTKQSSFKQDLMTLVDKKLALTTFFVDDIAFIRPWNIQDEKLKILIANRDIACLSLRMDPKYDFCYAMKRKQTIPIFDNNHCWVWKNSSCDWGYPMSLDGHVFRTPDIVPLLEQLQYDNPNLLEGALARRPLDRNKMICYREGKIINNPVNKVQTVNQNIYGQQHPVDAVFLNQAFIEGNLIDNKSLGDITRFVAVHQEFPISLIRE